VFPSAPLRERAQGTRSGNAQFLNGMILKFFPVAERLPVSGQEVEATIQ